MSVRYPYGRSTLLLLKVMKSNFTANRSQQCWNKHAHTYFCLSRLWQDGSMTPTPTHTCACTLTTSICHKGPFTFTTHIQIAHIQKSQELGTTHTHTETGLIQSEQLNVTWCGPYLGILTNVVRLLDQEPPLEESWGRCWTTVPGGCGTGHGTDSLWLLKIPWLCPPYDPLVSH